MRNFLLFVFLFLLAGAALAWDPAPSNDPPACPSSVLGCNPPINTSNIPQRKIGTLQLGDTTEVPWTDMALDVRGRGYVRDNLWIDGPAFARGLNLWPDKSHASDPSYPNGGSIGLWPLSGWEGRTAPDGGKIEPVFFDNFNSSARVFFNRGRNLYIFGAPLEDLSLGAQHERGILITTPVRGSVTGSPITLSSYGSDLSISSGGHVNDEQTGVAVRAANTYINPTQGQVGIGTSVGDANANVKLVVGGQVKITGGVPGAGKVLTSDAGGVASWQPAGGGYAPVVFCNKNCGGRYPYAVGGYGDTNDISDFAFGDGCTGDLQWRGTGAAITYLCSRYPIEP